MPNCLLSLFLAAVCLAHALAKPALSSDEGELSIQLDLK